MLYLLNKDVRTVRWNGEPLHEATSAIVKEIMNGDFTLTVKYPISDSGIYQLIQEDMLIKAPTPVLGAQLFRIKKPVEYNDHLEITAYHISDDVMQRSITPVSVTSQSCGMALSRMVQNTKTALGDFSFNSNIQDRRTFNTTETETLYSILLDGKHSIVGTWEGELVRDNFAITVKKSRGENRGVVITTHKNLKNYQRTKNSQNVVTRIHAKSTFKPEGAEKETTIRVTVDSPLINSYPYINEKEYENNNAKTVEELQKWAQSKFSNEGIDKVSDAIKIEAYELDGQVVHMGDTVNLKSWKHNVDAFKKAIAYEFDALKEEYISLTFDDKAGIGGSRASGGLSSAADAILGVTESAQEIALDKALQNADLDFDHKAGLLRQEISDDIELAKAKAEEVKRELSDTINQRFNSFDNGPLKETKRKAEEALRQAGASSSLAQEAKRIGLDSVARLEAFKSQTTSAQTALSGDLDALKRTIVNDIRPKQAQAEAEIAKQAEALSRTKNELAGASTLLAQEAKRIELDSVARLEAFKSQTTSAQTALSGDLDVLKRTIANDIRPKQAQAEAEIAKQVEALSRTKNELSGASTLLAQEAKRIELDSVARLEAFKSQTTSAQTALSGDLDVLKRTIANDIRPKQAQAEAEIAKQVEVLSRTKNELAGVKSAQATYEETTTRRLSELTNLANGKASKSELTQTAEELASRIASVQAGSSRNYFRNSRSRTFTTGGQAVYDYRTFIVPDFWKNSDRFKRDYVRISFDVTFPVALVNDMPAMVHFSAHPWYAYRNLIFKGGTVERQHFEFTIDLSSSSEDYQTNNVFIRFGTNYGFPAGLQVVIENAMLSVGNYFPAYQPAYEDQEDRVSVVESNFKQRADSLDAGVSRLTEGLRTKADISSLNVTAENIRQSVKSLETDTQNKLNQKLSQAEFEVRAGSIRQEILNATKDKASKSELTQTAEELSSKIASVQASGRNLFLNSLFKQDISKTGIWTTSTYTAAIDSESKYLGHKALKIIGLNPSGRDGGNPKVTYPALGQFGKVIPGSTTNQDVTISFYAKANKNGIMLRSRLGNIGYKTGNVTLSTEIKRYVVHIPKGWTNESKQTTNEWLFNFNQEGTIWIWMPKFEISDVDTSYSEAPEDIEGQISTVESTFKQRANSLEAGVNRLTEGLRTKADISSLNVTAENIRQSVKSLETDTQNKLNQKLSQAEFEVRAGSIRQEILNATKDKASKSELTQTAEELASKIASVHLGRRNLLKGTKELARYKPVSEYNGFKVIRTVAGATRYQDSYVERTVIPTAGTEYIAIFYARASENDYPVRCHFYNPNTVVSSENSSGYKSRSSDGLSIIRLSTDWQLCWVKWTQTATDQAKTVIIGRHGPQVGGKEGVWVEICAPAIFEGNLAGDWSPAYEDQDERVSAVESNFKQRADSLEAGVSRLTEGLRTKADISSLNVTAENIRQSVKSLETDTQNKLNQKLSQAEFEVRAGSIRQEILNATKDKASKSELTQTAEELSSKIASVQVGGRNYIRGTKRMMLARGLWASGTFRPSGAGTAKTIDVSDSPATGFDKAIRLTSSNARDQIGIAQDGFYISQGTYTMSCWVKGRRGQKVKLQTYWQVNDNSGISPIFTLKDENWTKLSFTSARNRAGVASIGYVYLVNAEVGEYLDVLAPQLEDGSLATSSKEAPEDIEGQISTVESTFKQRADSLAAGVNRLTEGLRTKADISALNVTAENIRQSVKSLETDTQNKLNQKLSQAEFEVRAGSIRQEILNATKDKASKSELTQTAEELASRIASVQASGRNLFLNSLFKQDIPKTGIWTTSTYTAAIDSESKYLGHKALKIIGLNPSGRDGGNPKVIYPALGQFGKVIPGSTTNQDVTISFYAKANKNGIMLRSRLGNIGYKTGNVTLSTEIKRYVVHIPKGWTNESKQTTNEWLFNFNQEGTIWIWMPKFEISDVDTSYSEAPEDIEGQISTVRQEILNATKDKASKSELTQTAEELSSKIASVQASGRNLFLNSLFKQDIPKTGIWTTSTYTAAIDSESKYLGHKALKIIGLNPSGRDGGNPKVIYPALGQFGKVIPGSTTNQDVTISFYAKANKNGIMLRSRLGNIGYKTGNVTLSTEIKRYVVHIPKGWTNESKQTTNEWLFNFNQEGTIWIWMPKFEISDVDTSYSEAPEDIEGQISTVESNFKQRADSLEAGVSRLTEGLRTKADISALNVTAENIRQSVKSLETDTQNKLNQKLSQAEFEVRAGSIRQEILNVTKDKASKSELTQTAEELSSKIASVQVGGINLLRNTASLLIGDRSKGCWMSASGGNGRAISVEVLDPPKKMIKNMIRVIENTNGGNKDLTQLVRLRIGEKYTISCYARIASDSPNANVNLLFRSWANNTDLNRKFQKSISHKNWQKYSFTFTADAIENSIQFGQSGAGIIEICAPKIESGTLATDYSEAPEDIEGQISTVESTFKQRANSLDAGVSRLTEGLRTKVDISALNVTAENIRQSVKSLETDTQNKLNQKLSQAEFEVRAGSIRQEILNATKDKADKTLVVSEAGKLREEFSKMKVGGRNLWIKSKTVGAVIEKLPENHVTGQKECYRLENNSTLTFNLEPDFSSRLYQKVTFSAWIKYENVVQGRNFWNVFNCFKHYLFRKNSETGVQSGPDYATLGMYKGSADWKYITFTYDYSEKTNFDQLKTSLRFNLEGATSGTAWVTGIKVEIGSVATDWSPAPEDADGLITEAKATFERTAQGLRTDLSAIQEYVNKDGQRQEALQRYTREESARQATAVRELVNRDFVGKATYQEDVKGINQRIEAVKTSANKDIASQIASYRQSVDGKFTDISSQITTYKQDVGGQISGLSNRLTSSEQGTTTQISNISNRINSNKQGTDNQISNLKTQVATNKDNAERQMGRISDQVSANKANADSQFANVTNQLVRKVETTDFQRVKETSKLYERILGNTENGIADKVARMALTNQLFQVEVGKYSVSGPNLIKNSDFKNATNEWGSTQNLGRLVKHSFYHNGQKDLMRLSNATKNENFLYSHRFNLERNTDYVLNFRGFNNSALASYDVYILGRRAGESDGFTIVKKVVSSKKLSTSRCEDVSVTFNSGEMDNAYIRFDNNGSSSGTADLYITEVDLYKGYKPRTWQPHPEDAVADANKKLEATQTKMTQLAGSWVVQNINSAGDIISGINLGANGHNRFVGKLTHITGETLIDRAVIKSAMVDKLKTGNFEAGSVTTTILDAEAVTAEKLKVDDALIKKLTANDAFIDQLISKRIFSIKVESVISSSTFLEAYQGRIGGFTLGQFDQGGGRWISGVNQFSVGMGNGAGYGVRTAFWANWGNNWNYAGPKAWNVNTDGKMYCRNEVGFYDQVDFSNSSRANFYGNTTFSRSPVFSNGIELGSKDVLGDGWNPKGGRNAVVWWNQVGSGSVKYWMEQKSDRRLKENITDTAVKALDKINRLRMVAFDFIENKKHEEIGLIAQEAETIVPRIVSRDPENPDGYLHIDYTALVPYLIKAIQELNQKIEKMEKTIA
ncbi:PblB, putative [Streptococcus pneumoniae]|nr:PblB, putative [Streptococcus pneumoniae]